MLIKYRVTGGSLCFGFTGAISEAYYSLKQLLHIWRLVSDHGKFFGLSFFRLQINIQIILGFIGMLIKCSSHYSFIVENLSWQLFIGLTLKVLLLYVILSTQQMLLELKVVCGVQMWRGVQCPFPNKDKAKPKGLR